MKMNKEHRFYLGSGHPEVNSPTSCFACITSLSGVVTVWWKKVQRELDSILLSSDVLVSTSPLQGALPTPFIEGAKLAGEASRFARGDSGNSGGEDAGARRIAGYGGRTSVGSPGVLWQGRRGTPPVLSVLSPVSAQSRRNTIRRAP